MQQPSSLNVSAPPAPVIKSAAPVKLTYDEVRRAAVLSVMEDFTRQKQYRHRVEHLKATGGNVQVIHKKAVADANGAAVSKESATRLLKEHSSAAWSVFFYQWSLFGFTGISSVATAMGFYLAIYHNRMFLPLGPIAAAVTWRMWDLLEAAWEQQRYIENAAHLRDARKGNPMHMVAKRVGNKEVAEPLEDVV
ncbi:hypothetical protein DQ04_09671000 [Trypanosoma grayi]|uniref:hypothetical protein n=1 Tax=Trypanosoma grayi TaxID=71804 RepID=UPI0004F41655|nr:hypothetical protein DQ04_09671000 [Trypanosoma grayi]KEG07481.1 hypothetical protein DQ04_09671000 [Trypanosoma grayi]